MILEAIVAQAICSTDMCKKSTEAFSKQTNIESIENNKKKELTDFTGKTTNIIVGNGYSVYRLINNKKVNIKMGNKTLNFDKNNVKFEIKWSF